MEMKVFLFSNQASFPAILSARISLFKAAGKGELANIDKRGNAVVLLRHPPRFDYTNLIAQLSILRAIGANFLL
ncbi:MAG: hypothetical protein ACTIKR_00220 [Advenella sp.]|nr:hypothetical protein [Advenella sp. FME57]